MRTRLPAPLLAGVLALAAACGPGGPAVMQFVEISPTQPRIGDVVTVRFSLLDDRGLPLAGQTVNFKLQSASNGVSLSPTSVQSLKGSGFAETQLIATSRVNSVIVVATAGNKQVTTPPITFAGSVPNARQLTFQCGEFAGPASGGRHAIGAYDSTRHLIAGVKIHCTAHTGDRNGDGVPNALVSFLTEAGTVGPTQTSQTDVIGNATILYKTSLPFPQELGQGTFSWTPPIDASHLGTYLAPLWMHPYEWVDNPLTIVNSASPAYTLREPHRPDPIRLKPDGSGHYENNPRDNLVTMIAVTAGEEGFTDKNNNGVRDEDEEFDDLPEPFVDANDNGTWDPGEAFIDINGNRNWDPANGLWDSSTLIWVQERILWTGIPDPEDEVLTAANPRPVSATVTPAAVILRCPTGVPVGGACYQAGAADSSGTPTGVATVTVTTYISDPWFNSLARNSDSDGCTVGVGGKAPVELRSTNETGQAFTYPAGEVMYFTVGDARDPNQPPASQVPRRAFPISFSLPINCRFTASDLDGYVVQLSVGSISGTID